MADSGTKARTPADSPARDETGDALRELRHRSQIIDLMYRYASALDERDWQRLATCFTPDAVGLYGPVLGRLDGFEAIQRVCRSTLEPLDSSQHIVTNIEIEFADAAARVRSCFHAQHTRAAAPGGDNFVIGGTYLDQVVHTASGWRIRQRDLRMVWQEGNPRVVAAGDETTKESAR